jgi:RNA-directed DNA polymerase
LNNDADATGGAWPPPWFKRRGYPHFDRPLDADQAVKIATDLNAVAKRSFLPFLAFDINQRRYKKQDDGTRKKDIKRRPVAFASHADAAIFSYYAYLLKQPYEAALATRGLCDHVLAYRRFNPPKCNIHFANEAFAEIERRGACVAVALDIEKFFDTIPHDALKRLWALLLDRADLPADHYAVFKAVTRWAKADREKVFKALGIGRRRSENWKHPETLCSPREFREKIRAMGLVEKGFQIRDGRPVGIPQGSPISAILSNLVMLEADTAVVAAASIHGVYYRRYSDDILLIGADDEVAAVESVFKDAMRNLGLEVNDAKTKRATFTPTGDGLLDASEPLQYLGFVFDGQRIVVRPQTIAKFVQRMKRGVRSAKRAAKSASSRGGSRKLRRQELYARYSHLGPTLSMLERNPTSNLRNNFYTYAKRSGTEMDRDEIKRQLRRHWNRLNAEIKLADKKD